MIIGCDTGFFVEFIAKNPVVRQLTQEAVRGEHTLVTSVVCIYELKKLGLTGMVSKDTAFQVAADIPALCDVIFTVKGGMTVTTTLSGFSVFHRLFRQQHQRRAHIIIGGPGRSLSGLPNST